MNELKINTNTLPVTISGAYDIASSPFIHIDRTADFDILIYVTEGYICVTEEEHDYVIHKGEAFFLKKGLHHYGKHEIPQGTSWYYIHFKNGNSLCTPTPFIIENEPGNQGLIHREMSYELTLPKQFTVAAQSRLAQMIMDFIDYLNSSEPLRRWNLNIRLFQLLSECALQDLPASSPSSLSDRICHFLGDHVQEPFHSSRLQDHFHLSYKYMAACFKKETGTTIQSYHTTLKLNLACRLLRSTMLPIKEISLKLGYQDVLYFSRIFHSRIGCSPSAYRRREEI